MKNNMNKADFTKEVKSAFRLVTSNLSSNNLEITGLLTLVTDGSEDEASGISEAIGIAYAYYQEGSRYFTIRSNIGLTTSSWIELDYFRATKANGRWSVEKDMHLYTGDGYTDMLLKRF